MADFLLYLGLTLLFCVALAGIVLIDKVTHETRRP